MCITSPGRVLEVSGATALVDLDGRPRRASLVVVPDVAVGDWVVVAAGTVLEVLDPAEAAEIQALLALAAEGPPGTSS
jgi:hydrogenase expression/formation protein HypC